MKLLKPILICQIIIVSIFFNTAVGQTLENTKASAKKLVIGIKSSPPFVIIKDGNNKPSGLSIILWEDIAKKMNLEYEYKFYEDIPLLLNGLEKQEVDLCINPITVTRERIEKFDFSQPFYISNLSVAIKKEDTYMTLIKSIFNIALIKALLSLIVIIFIFGFLTWLVERRANPEQFNPGAKGIGDGFWWSAVTMTTVGYGDKAPQTILGRFLGFLWMFIAVITVSSFTASITSALTASKLGVNISNFSDLRKLSVGTIKGTNSEHQLQMNQVDYTDYPDVATALKDISTGTLEAFLYDGPIIDYYIKEEQLENKVTILPQSFTTDYYSFAYPEDSPLVERIDPYVVDEINTTKWKIILGND